MIPYWKVDMSLFAILLFAATMALSLWATMRVRQVYGEFSLLRATSGLTGADAAATILQQEGIYDVEIVQQDQALGDHHDPSRMRLVLSGETLHRMSAVALGVAALNYSSCRVRRLSKGATGAQGDRAYSNGARRESRRADTTGSSLDLCSRVPHQLPFAFVATVGGRRE